MIPREDCKHSHAYHPRHDVFLIRLPSCRPATGKRIDCFLVQLVGMSSAETQTERTEKDELVRASINQKLEETGEKEK